MFSGNERVWATDASGSVFDEDYWGGNAKFKNTAKFYVVDDQGNVKETSWAELAPKYRHSGWDESDYQMGQTSDMNRYLQQNYKNQSTYSDDMDLYGRTFGDALLQSYGIPVEATTIVAGAIFGPWARGKALDVAATEYAKMQLKKQGKKVTQKAIKETAEKAVEFAIEGSMKRHNLELDLFGGEPLMNWDVVKQLVEYARSVEKEKGKNFRFTLTTNGVLIDDDGTSYIYWSGMGLSGCRLKDNMIELDGEPQRLDTPLPEGFKEGPFVFKHKGKYYLTYPWVRENTETLAYAMSDSPLGPFEYKGIFSEVAGNSNTTHPGIVEFKGKTILFTHNGALPSGTSYSRSVCAQELKYDKEGNILKCDITSLAVGCDMI